MVAVAGPSALPSVTTLPSLMPRSPEKPGLPVPSTIVPPVILRSKAIACPLGLLLNVRPVYVLGGKERKHMAKHKIALIPGDGIGKEVLPEGVRVLEAAGRRFNFQLEFTDFDWSCDRFAKTGKMMPDDGMETLKQFESIFLGAVGWPGVPDHVSLWGLLIPIRREFDEYVNLRPVRLFEGVPSPLANRQPGDIDFWVVRENTEGEYSQLGGRMFQGTENEMAVQEAVFTRKGV